jgi:hypothetical protein
MIGHRGGLWVFIYCYWPLRLFIVYSSRSVRRAQPLREAIHHFSDRERQFAYDLRFSDSFAVFMKDCRDANSTWVS